MSRTGATYQAAARGINPRPTVLLEIATGLTSAGDEWIRFTSDDADRVWPSTGGATYTARPFQQTDFSVNPEDSGRFRVTFDDTDDFFDTWLLSTDFNWKKVNRYLIDRSVTGFTAQAQMDTFRVTNIEREDRQITFMAEPLSAILSRVTVPQRTMTRDVFPGILTEGRVR